jgi:GH15 family glucan-1,4-alpha-glucosidase
VDNYLLQRRLPDAEKLYQRLVKLANDVGLLAEEYEPRARRMLGNFPQAFSHVALVNSGINLMHAHAMMPKRRGRKRPHVVRHRE